MDGTPSVVRVEVNPIRRMKPIVLTPLSRDPDDLISPFTNEIMKAHISRKFKMPTIKVYNEAGDPTNNIRTFSNALFVHHVSDAIKCRVYPQTVRGIT